MSFIRSEPKELKNIPIWDQFYKVALNIVKPLLETYNGNTYILMAIDHYCTQCEAKEVIDHDVETNASFLEDEIICRFGMPNYVFTNYGSKWAT